MSGSLPHVQTSLSSAGWNSRISKNSTNSNNNRKSTSARRTKKCTFRVFAKVGVMAILNQTQTSGCKMREKIPNVERCNFAGREKPLVGRSKKREPRRYSRAGRDLDKIRTAISRMGP